MLKLNKSRYDADGVEFTIYETTKFTKSGPKKYWLLQDYSTGERRLLNNRTLRAAKQRARKIRAAMVRGQVDRLSLSNVQWRDVCVALEIVHGVSAEGSLATAARSWAECMRLLNGKETLVDAIKQYVANNNLTKPVVGSVPFAKTARLYQVFKVKSGVSKSHCDNIRCRLARLETVLPTSASLGDLTSGQLDSAVLNLDIGPKTKNEYRLVLSNLYNWAAKQNPPLVAKGFNPAMEMVRHRVEHHEVDFLHVEDLHRIVAALETKRQDLLPLVAFVCFAGLRPSEVARLDWMEVGDNYIRLPGTKSKTGYSRQIPIPQNLKKWSGKWRSEAGLVCGKVKLGDVNAAILAVSGVRLGHDAMRHGYGTHRQMILKNVAQVANEMGNSVEICRRHYLNAFCTEREAEEWFAISPSQGVLPSVRAE